MAGWQLDSITNSTDMNLRNLQAIMENRGAHVLLHHLVLVWPIVCQRDLFYFSKTINLKKKIFCLKKISVSGIVKDSESWHAAVHGVAKSQIRLSH